MIMNKPVPAYFRSKEKILNLKVDLDSNFGLNLFPPKDGGSYITVQLEKDLPKLLFTPFLQAIQTIPNLLNFE